MKSNIQILSAKIIYILIKNQDIFSRIAIHCKHKSLIIIKKNEMNLNSNEKELSISTQL